MKRLPRLAGGAILWAAALAGQFARLPQAETPEEFDAYLRVLDARTPAAAIAAGDEFLRGWPRSALRAHVLEREFEAYRELGDAAKAIRAGEEALRAAPDNLVVLAELAGVLANATQDEKRLARAEECARKVIELSRSFRVPRFLSPEEWEESYGRLNSQAHAALGLVANQRGDEAGAIREFETAVALAPQPDATQYYRLGLLYKAKGRMEDAAGKLRRAAEVGEPKIRDLAERELRGMGR